MEHPLYIQNLEIIRSCINHIRKLCSSTEAVKIIIRRLLLPEIKTCFRIPAEAHKIQIGRPKFIVPEFKCHGIDHNKAFLLFCVCCPFSATSSAKLERTKTLFLPWIVMYIFLIDRRCTFPLLNYKIWFRNEIEHLLCNILFGETTLLPLVYLGGTNGSLSMNIPA